MSRRAQHTESCRNADSPDSVWRQSNPGRTPDCLLAHDFFKIQHSRDIKKWTNFDISRKLSTTRVGFRSPTRIFATYALLVTIAHIDCTCDWMAVRKKSSKRVVEQNGKRFSKTGEFLAFCAQFDESNLAVVRYVLIFVMTSIINISAPLPVPMPGSDEESSRVPGESSRHGRASPPLPRMSRLSQLLTASQVNTNYFFSIPTFSSPLRNTKKTPVINPPKTHQKGP